MVYDRNQCITYFSGKYPYMSVADIGLLYDTASDIYINLRFPFNLEKVEVDEKELQKHPTWHLRVMQELIDRNGLTNVVGYRENGVSFTFDKTGLSQSLIDEIVGMADIS